MGGARSLSDVAARSDLTAQQRLGLTHFHDFSRRLARAEVAEAAAGVRRVTLEVLQVRACAVRAPVAYCL